MRTSSPGGDDRPISSGCQAIDGAARAATRKTPPRECGRRVRCQNPQAEPVKRGIWPRRDANEIGRVRLRVQLERGEPAPIGLAARDPEELGALALEHVDDGVEITGSSRSTITARLPGARTRPTDGPEAVSSTRSSPSPIFQVVPETAAVRHRAR